MRLAVELMRIQVPNGCKRLVVEPEPSVRGEHGDALAQGLDGLALHLDQRIVAALEADPFGHVLIKVSDAGFAIAIGDDMQRSTVGKVPLVLDLGIGSIGREPGFLPIAIISFLRQPTRLAQTVEDLAVPRMVGEPFGVELPELDIGLIEMGEALTCVEYGEG